MAHVPDERLDLPRLVDELQERVRIRYRDGFYPRDLAGDLAAHFARISGPGPRPSLDVGDAIALDLRRMDEFHFGRDRIDTASTAVPGGGQAHRAVGKVVSRHIGGTLRQMQDGAARARDAVGALHEASAAVARRYDTVTLQQLDDLEVRTTEQRDGAARSATVAQAVEMRLPDIVLAGYGDDHLTNRTRGAATNLRERVRIFADLLREAAPVLEIGVGRGELLELLRDLGTPARGVDRDPRVVAVACGRGLDVAQGEGLNVLRETADGSLGGLALLHVLDHLTGRDLVQCIRLAGAKLREGGRLVVETVNQASLAALADTLWLDPDRLRPVHPRLLRNLLDEAGFASVEGVEVPGPAPAGLARVGALGAGKVEDAGSESSAVDGNFDRLDAVLFGPRTYALLAVR